MERQELLPIELEDGTQIMMYATSLGGEEKVAFRNIKFEAVSKAIESFAKSTYSVIQKVKPTKGSIEFGVSVGLEAGKLIALIADGKTTASVKITLEWERKDE